MELDAVFNEAEALWFSGDRARAEPLLRYLAKLGHAHAASLLGQLCAEAGRRAEAIGWYRIAADQGWDTARVNLALLIGDTDRDEAVRLTREAAADGSVEAWHNLGIFLVEDGLLAEAEGCFRRAAGGIYPAARHRLAELLEATGRRVEAEAWYRRTIEDHGGYLDDREDAFYPVFTTVMTNLAGLLEATGRLGEALRWHRAAAARGGAESGAEADRLSREIGSAEV
ncbi:MAG: tetratricopeptide repeat protein [Streptosporangiaceae bacterium]